MRFLQRHCHYRAGLHIHGVFKAGTAVAELIEQEAEGKPLEKPRVHLGGIEEVVADKGYHSGELIERTFAHCYDTGGMRRTHLRKHNNILKRLLIHVAGANLGLLSRSAYGIGTPRGLQGLSVTFDFFVLLLASALEFENPRSIEAGVRDIEVMKSR